MTCRPYNKKRTDLEVEIAAIKAENEIEGQEIIMSGDVWVLGT